MSLQRIMVFGLIKSNKFQDNEKNYHDSLQADLIEGLSQFQYVKILTWHQG